MTIEQDIETITARIKEHKVNGGPEPEPEISTHRDLTPVEIEAGLLAFRRMHDELGALKDELANLKDEIVRKDVQIQEIHELKGRIEARVGQMISQRDEAVRESGELRGVLNSLAAILVRYHTMSNQE